MAETLAVFGGQPILSSPIPPHDTFGEEEKQAVLRVMDSGVLSNFLGRAGDRFLGGTEILQFEKAFSQRFGSAYAVSFNSATTGLEAAIAALLLPPGSEVIVPAYTMTASVTAIVVNQLVPVFADIDPKTFCLDPDSVESCITEKTGAIMAVNLFGGCPDYDRLLALAKKHDVKIIEDNAQGTGGMYKGKEFGTIGDMGVFSFNVHKTIQAGEGGVLVTNDKELAFHTQLKRNHGENVIDDLGLHDVPIVGSNYRMTEFHAAVSAVQLQKLDRLNTHRRELAQYLTARLQGIAGIVPFTEPKDTKHVYYVYPMFFSEKAFGISRAQFVEAMKAEGFALSAGYVKPIYLLNFFQDDSTYRIYPHLQKSRYHKGICPVTERCYETDLLTTGICHYPVTKAQIDLFVAAIQKVAAGKDQFSKE